MKTATEMNQHLASHGVIVITTYLQSRRYTSKHVGWFTTGADGNIYVKQGKHLECLTMNAGQTALVSIKFGTCANQEEHP